MRPLYPTAISTARRCWRRYGARYLFKVKTEGERRQARSLGDETHELFERWIKLGEVPQQDRSVADNMMLPALQFLPAPKTGVSEAESVLDLNGVRYKMRRDWQGCLSELPKGDSAQAMKIYGDLPAQLDLKTSSQPLRYGIWDRDAWLDDVQAVLEALELATRTNSDVVASRWLYLKSPSKTESGEYRLRGKTEALPSDIILGRDQLGRAHLKVIEPFAKGIIELQQAHDAGAIADWRSLPFNLEACHDYGGCDYKDLCKGTFSTAPLISAGYEAGQGKDTNMTAPGSLFAQFQNGQVPAPVVGQAPAFTPPAFVPPGAPQPGTPGMISTAGATFPPAPAAPSFTPPSAPAQPSPAVFSGFVGVNAPEVRVQNATANVPSNGGVVPQTTTAPAQAPVAAPPPALVPVEAKPGLCTISLTKADIIAMLEGALAALRQG